MELQEVLEELKRKKLKKIFLQFPEGLKNQFLEIADIVESNGMIPIISLETAYGACDVRENEALELKCDAIIHFGHSEFGFEKLYKKIPIYFVEYFIDVDISSILPTLKEITKNYKKIGIVYTIQYKNSAEQLKKLLKENEKEVYIGGQVLGCNFSNMKKMEKDVDVIILLTAGKFYALGAENQAEKPLIIVDLEKMKIINTKEELNKLKKILEWNKKVFEESEKIGILVSWKKGQIKNFDLVKDILAKMNKKSYILTFDELEEGMLEGLKLDCLINLACPRISLDDLERFKIPMIGLEDLLEIWKSKQVSTSQQ